MISWDHSLRLYDSALGLYDSNVPVTFLECPELQQPQECPQCPVCASDAEVRWRIIKQELQRKKKEETSKDPPPGPPGWDKFPYPGLVNFSDLPYKLSSRFVSEAIPLMAEMQEYIHFKVKTPGANILFISSTFNESLRFPDRNLINWSYARIHGHDAAHCYSYELEHAFGKSIPWRPIEHLWKIPCIYGSLLAFPQYDWLLFIDSDAFIRTHHFDVPLSHYLEKLEGDPAFIMFDRLDLNSGVFFVRNSFRGKRLIWIWLLENLLGVWRHLRLHPGMEVKKGTSSFLSDQMALVSIWYDEVQRAKNNTSSLHSLRNIINERDNQGRPCVRPVRWRTHVIHVMRDELNVYKPFWMHNHETGPFFFLSPMIHPPFQPEYQSVSDAFFVHPAGSAGKLRDEHLDWPLYEKEGTCPDYPAQPCKIYGIETF